MPANVDPNIQEQIICDTAGMMYLGTTIVNLVLDIFLKLSYQLEPTQCASCYLLIVTKCLQRHFQTSSYLATFILAMIKYPEAQAKAQQELDQILGKNQLPSFEDAGALPYLAATVKETLRWQLVTPLAIPHLSIQDDVYKGYTIPAGTVIIPNAWYAHIIC